MRFLSKMWAQNLTRAIYICIYIYTYRLEGYFRCLVWGFWKILQKHLSKQVLKLGMSKVLLFSQGAFWLPRYQLWSLAQKVTKRCLLWVTQSKAKPPERVKNESPESRMGKSERTPHCRVPQDNHRGQTINANFFCTKFFKNPSGHGRPRQKSWTSAPKSAFFCGPGGDAEKLFDPGSSRRKGQECPREIQTKKFMFTVGPTIIT